MTWADEMATTPAFPTIRELDDQREPELAWSMNPFTRCRAVLEPKEGHVYFGRCELKRRHRSSHALERGFDTVFFLTKVISRYPNY